MKMLYDGEWISAKPLLNQSFPVDDPTCEICREASSAKAWISVSRHIVRCRKCFTPTKLDDRGTGIDAKRLIKGQRGSLTLSDPEDLQELAERLQPFVDSVRDLECRNRLVLEIKRQIGLEVISS